MEEKKNPLKIQIMTIIISHCMPIKTGHLPQQCAGGQCDC